MWNGKEIKFGELEISCEIVTDGVLVSIQDENICKDRIFSDSQLCSYIGYRNYSAFHYSAQQLNEYVKVTDFNQELLEENFNFGQQKQHECFKIVSSILPPGTKVLEGWRNFKCILAASTVLLSNYDWSNQNSVELVQRYHNVGDYMINALDYISNSSNTKNINYQKAVRYFQNQLENCKEIMQEKTSITCYGFDPPKCPPCSKLNFSENTWGPAVLVALIGFLFLLVIICWFRFY